MGWGSEFGNRLEYAVGSFNGQRNGYVEFNSSQDIMAFLNFKPFYNRVGAPRCGTFASAARSTRVSKTIRSRRPS